MAHRKYGNAFDDAMELLIENGFDSMADVLRDQQRHMDSDTHSPGDNKTLIRTASKKVRVFLFCCIFFGLGVVFWRVFLEMAWMDSMLP